MAWTSVMESPAAVRRRQRREQDEIDRRWASTKARILRQRAVFKAVPDSPEKLALELMMLERAWWLLDGGGEADCEAADALLEFVAEWRALKLLDEFFETRNEWDAALYTNGEPVVDPMPAPSNVVMMRPLPAEEHKDAILAMWAAGETVKEITGRLGIPYHQGYAIIQRERQFGNPLAARRQWDAPLTSTAPR